MNKIRYSILLLLCTLFTSLSLVGQNTSDMKINEILVHNVDNFMDDYGHKNGWIELFNSSYGSVDVGGCYLTNDPNNLTMYMIPKGDVLTKVKPRQHILFWADNQPYRGTFHINFRLEDSKEILFVSNDGRTIIDRIKIPHEILSDDISYGRTTDGGDEWAILEKSSPSTNNYGADLEPAGMKFMQVDPYGIIMSVTAMSVVFISLILLYIVFKHYGKYNVRKSKERAALAAGKSANEICTSCEEASGEVYAAIATALHLYFEDDESHDIENTILTIERVTRNYSPWSSKIYTLRETPNKK